ncbi:MAG: hypothetical protein ABJB40_08695 [Acidobacteriota bacterium]
MSEDYLWDKTGEDQELERLESVLSVFRYQEKDAPVLPAIGAVQIPEHKSRWSFSFAFAFAGAMAVIVIGFGLFWLIPRNDRRVAVINPAFPVTGVEMEVPDKTLPLVEKPLQNVPSDSLTGEIKPTRVRHSIRAAYKQPKTVAKTQKKVRIEDLTKEERYAYNQLMLALSITSSKLMVVRDTIDRMENDKATDKQNFK